MIEIFETETKSKAAKCTTMDCFDFLSKLNDMEPDVGFDFLFEGYEDKGEKAEVPDNLIRLKIAYEVLKGSEQAKMRCYAAISKHKVGKIALEGGMERGELPKAFIILEIMMMKADRAFRSIAVMRKN